MPATSSVVHCDPDILGGTPVFVGTRVPVRALLDYLEAGDSLYEFLEDFPSVTPEQAKAAGELAKHMLVSHAPPAWRMGAAPAAAVALRSGCAYGWGDGLIP